MIKSIPILLISIFSTTVGHAAAVDWTPLLQSMKQSCFLDLEILPYEKSDIGRLPAKYRASVAHSHSKQTASDGEALTIELKNSVAFGQPLSALVIESNEQKRRKEKQYTLGSIQTLYVQRVCKCYNF